MKRTRRHIIACLTVVAGLLAACHSGDGQVAKLDVPVELLRHGDLAFRCGTSLESRFVTGVDGENGPYSHIGLVVNVDGEWFVAHAVPGENEPGEPQYLKLDSISVYYGADRAKLGCIMRVTEDSAAIAAATAYALWAVRARKEFDDAFDWDDTTQLYCTELVQQAYLHGGIDLAQKRKTDINTVPFKGKYVFPGDIARNELLTVISTF